jgi:hypothetical protein
MTKFDELLKDVRLQLTDAQTHLDIHETILTTDAKDLKIHQDILDMFIGFFGPTANAHGGMFIIKTWNAIDPKGKACIRELVRMLKREPTLAPSVDVTELDNRLGKLEKMHKKIKLVRNKRVAHHDPKARIEDIPIKACHDLLDELQAVYNVIHRGHDDEGSAWSFQIWEHRHTENLLAVLREWLSEKRNITTRAAQ